MLHDMILSWSKPQNIPEENVFSENQKLCCVCQNSGSQNISRNFLAENGI